MRVNFLNNYSVMKILVFLLFFPFALQAQNSHASLIAQFMKGQHDYFKFNGNVLVAENGKVIYQDALGYADFNTKRQLDTNSVFELASVSKQFTAMGTMICMEKGLLKYDDRVIKFFPAFPYKTITVRHLLTNTSGLPTYDNKFDEVLGYGKIATNKDLFYIIKKAYEPLLFAPGTEWKYSNTNYILLAAIIEKISGTTFSDFMAKNVFGPLGMKRTFVYNTRRSTKKIPENYALGFVYSDSLERYTLPDSLSQFNWVITLDGVVGDIGVNSTIGDLFTWDRALYGNKLVSKATLAEMLSPLVKTSPLDPTSFYGFGERIQTKTMKGKLVYHSGSWPGYSSFLSRYVDSNLTSIILSNNESNVLGLDAGIRSILFNQPLLMPYEHKRITIDTRILGRYAGEYSGSISLTLVTKNGKLYRQTRGSKDIELIPESDTKFFFADGTDKQVEFMIGYDGQVAGGWFINMGQTGELIKL
jgi:CubicO group peptidase (beta-lactamase class C family)